MKNSGISLDKLNPRARAEAMAILGLTPLKTPAVSKPRVRQDGKGMNKTEEEFFEFAKYDLSIIYPDAAWFAQAITLKIANGVRYTPDVAVMYAGGVAFYEVKGFLRDDAAVKIKVAAHQYRLSKFFLVTKRNRKAGGGWQIDLILP